MSLLGKRRHGDFSEFTVVSERLPARTLLYQSVRLSSGTLDDMGYRTHFELLLPNFVPGTRVCEYILKQTAFLALYDEAPSDEVLRDHGCDGWRSIDGTRLTFLDPASMLQLIDDDKHVGLSQALLPDMFFRKSLQA